MKHAIIISILVCSAAFAANEIQSFNAGATTCFAVVRELDGDVWYPVGQVFEVWGTLARTAADYDIALTSKSGGMFVGNFDTNISAGYYYIVSHQQAAGAPADTDPATWAEYGYWDGDEWLKGITQDVNGITPTAADNADAVWDEASTGHLDAGKAGQQQWTDVDAILADTDELQTDWTNGGRLDLLIDAIKYKTDLITIVDTVVKDANDANNFTIEDGRDVNDAYWFSVIMVTDADTSLSEVRYIDRYDENSGDPNVWVDEKFSFTPAANDVVHIMGTSYGGYLDMIYDFVRQSKAVINYINGTGSGSGSTPAGTQYINKQDDYGVIPGI